MRGLTLRQDDQGWDYSACDCGWTGPPCPGKEIAAEFYTEHCLVDHPEDHVRQ